MIVDAKSGYVMNVSPDVSASVVTVGASTCNAATLDAVSGYFAEGHPVSVGVSGQRSFATDARGYLVIDGNMETSCRGAFAAGDVANPAHPCIATALASGAIAARQIAKRLACNDAATR